MYYKVYNKLLKIYKIVFQDLYENFTAGKKEF